MAFIKHTFLTKNFLAAEHILRNKIKRLILFPKGFRAHRTVGLAWSLSADAGGRQGSITIGQGTRIDRGVILRAYGASIHVGNHCSINPYCVLIGGGDVNIGNGVRIASHAVIVAASHNFSDTSRPIHEQGETPQPITIENDVWIGAGAKILGGVTIRTGTIVGAGAVVTRSTDPWSIMAGVPARKIGARCTE